MNTDQHRLRTAEPRETQGAAHGFAERRKAKGKPHKVIVVACIRKLFSILNALLNRGEKWDANRFAIPA